MKIFNWFKPKYKSPDYSDLYKNHLNSGLESANEYLKSRGIDGPKSLYKNMAT
jgi:hypothetical protein